MSMIKNQATNSKASDDAARPSVHSKEYLLTHMHEITLPHGPLEYLDVGHGPVLLLLHGTLANSHNWRAVLPELSKSYRCIVPNLPLGGHRLPLKPDADLSAVGICHLLVDFLDELNLDSIAILSNDTGGAYAQIFCAKYPTRVTAMVLTNCDAFEVFPPKPFASLPKMIKIPGYLSLMGLMFRIKPLLTSKLVLGLLSNKLTKEDVYNNYIFEFSKNKNIRADFKKAVNAWSKNDTIEAAKQLQEFGNPVAIFWGGNDQLLFPESLGRRLSQVFSNSEFCIIDDASTYVQVDQPEALVAKVKGFLERALK